MTIWNKTFDVTNMYFYWMYVRSSSLLVNNSVVKYVWDAPPYHSRTFFLKFLKRMGGCGVFKPMIHKKLEKLQWPIVLKTKILNKNSDLRLILEFNWCSIWATVNMGTKELGPPCNLCHMFFRGPKLQCCFFYWSQKVLPVCWGFN